MVTKFGGTLLLRLSPQKRWSEVDNFSHKCYRALSYLRALLVLFPVLTNSNRGGEILECLPLTPVLVRVTRYHSDGPNIMSRVHVPRNLLLLVMASVLGHSGPQFNICTRPPAIASFPDSLPPPVFEERAWGRG